MPPCLPVRYFTRPGVRSRGGLMALRPCIPGRNPSAFQKSPDASGSLPGSGLPAPSLGDTRGKQFHFGALRNRVKNLVVQGSRAELGRESTGTRWLRMALGRPRASVCCVSGSNSLEQRFATARAQCNSGSFVQCALGAEGERRGDFLANCGDWLWVCGPCDRRMFGRGGARSRLHGH